MVREAQTTDSGFLAGSILTEDPAVPGTGVLDATVYPLNTTDLPGTGLVMPDVGLAIVEDPTVPGTGQIGA